MALDPAQVAAHARTENFPIASLLFPRALRPHLHAIYGFARLVDILGDEWEGDRLAVLDELEVEVERCYTGEPRWPVMVRLQPTIREFTLPREPFVRLIEANRRDQRQAVYATFGELAAYCDLSANPVGELVLHVFGAATPARIAMSDDVCTALQLLEHWQDVQEDWARGRVYLPAEDLERFGVPPGQTTEELLAFEIERARTLLDRGAPLVGTLRGRARLAVAGYVGGGRAGLDALAAGSRKASKTARVVATLKTFVRGR